jgi:glycosyltransferase involved in cell wall biosynthesis
MRIALVGTRGAPAQYGGFETAVEEIGARLADNGHAVTVYCRNRGQRIRSHRGMRLVNLPALRLKAAETLSHSFLSASHQLVRRSDVALVFNAANAPILPLLKARGVPTALHMDGLEWKRGKWGPTGRKYYIACERLGVWWADALIADAHGIADYYRETYGATTAYLPYGAPILRDHDGSRLEELGLRPFGYHLVVARFEPENNVDLIIEGYTKSNAALPLVVVGSAPYPGESAERIARLATEDDRVMLTGSIYDQPLLDQLYANAKSYLHGHSVGGTNPSLLRAMGAGAPITAIDVVFTREVLGGCGEFFRTAAEVAQGVDEVESDPATAWQRGCRGRERAERNYNWDSVAAGYERLCVSLVEGKSHARVRSERGAPTVHDPLGLITPG